jgi:hypothetical protein
MDRNWFAQLRARAASKKLADRPTKANSEIATALYANRQGLLKRMANLEAAMELEIRLNGVPSTESITEMASCVLAVREFATALAATDELAVRDVVRLCEQSDGGNQ